ncbi:hypothetical protein AGOR_G00207670 [Albula goreensis]|uniref:Cation-dependent mannose-6-phosphate receptor n=1 Tax=Albula goreensis TaxID=1534307 RepID=A0A8T3CT05_9TELE|nr:hypothetical protein AGOR_G00207670 [Albula goreensis]
MSIDSTDMDKSPLEFHVYSKEEMAAFQAIHLTLTSAILLVLLAEKAQGSENTKSCKLIEETEKARKVVSRLEPITNRTFSVKAQSGQDSYTYLFQVCGNAGQTADGAVVQKSDDGNEIVIGKYTAMEAFGGSDWVMLIYTDGSAYGEHCNKEKRRAIVMISCERGITAGDLSVVEEEREKLNNCFYLFELDSSAVCPLIPSHLSAGSILLIVGFSLLAVYLIGGFLYQRLVVGAKGMEQFPHLTFWQEIGSLTADGCDFVCRCRGSQEEPPTYRGVATEPLGEEPEERDDHLLPM